MIVELLPGKLWIGSEPRSARMLTQLRDLRITAVLCLIRQSRSPALVWLTDYAQIPLTDGKQVDQHAVWRAVMQVRLWLSEGMRVYAHCRAGRNRSALVGAVILATQLRLTGEVAIARVRALRPRALANPAGEAFLRALPPPITYHDLRQRELAVELNLMHRRGLGGGA